MQTAICFYIIFFFLLKRLHKWEAPFPFLQILEIDVLPQNFYYHVMKVLKLIATANVNLHPFNK